MARRWSSSIALRRHRHALLPERQIAQMLAGEEIWLPAICLEPPAVGLPKPQREMGAGIAASPHLRRAKDPPVFVSFGDPKVSCSPILAHQLRRRFGSWIPIRRRVPLPSAALLGPIPFRVACVPRDTAFRARKTGSSGASAGWSNSKPKLLLIACRWRSDLPPLPPERGWDFRPDHPFLMNLAPSRAKRIRQCIACG